MSVRKEDYQSDVECAWCPGCGNFGILEAVKRALVQLELAPHQVLLCSGIGQAPKLPHYLKVNTFNGLHGRELPAATAAKLCAPDLTVLVHSGDGGAYGEGGNHLLHAMRRNIDLTLVVHDNKIYGLTKGQASPTTASGTVTDFPRTELVESPVNPLALAISQSCGFVAQGMSARIEQLVDLLCAAIEHRGFSLVNVLQPCVTWDKVHTYAHYQTHCQDLGAEHDPGDRLRAFERVTRPSDKIPLGVIYREHRPSFQDRLLGPERQSLRTQPLDPERVKALFPRFL